jgi:hypothetical protein
VALPRLAWVSSAPAGVLAGGRWAAGRLLGSEPQPAHPHARHVLPRPASLASVDLWPCATRFRALHMGEGVCAIPDLRAVGSTLLRPWLRAAGLFGRAGRGPTPPSSTAAPSHTPPRRCLRGFQATIGSHSLCRHGMPVCAVARGPVRAAADTPLPLDCPRARLGCQAAFLPPIGSATRPNRHCALPHLIAPEGLTRKAPAPLRSARATDSCHPPSPS